jgi:hypothetical protein
MVFIRAASCSVACPQINRSSANKREWMEGQFGPRVIPAKELVDIASCRAMDNSFIARTKR